MTNLDSAIRDLETALRQDRDARRTEARQRFGEALDSAEKEIGSREAALVTSLRHHLQQSVAAERTAFAQLDLSLRSLERRQSAWLRLLSWNIKYKATLAGVLRGLGGPLAGALGVVANAVIVPYGPKSDRSPRHARDLVNIDRAASALGPIDQLCRSSFLADREQRLGDLSPVGRWATRLGFPCHLTREALGYVGELGHVRAVAERDLIREDVADSGLGRRRTPLRRDLAARRRMVALALARLSERQAGPAVQQLAGTARVGLEAVGHAGSDLFAALDSDMDQQLFEQLSALQASLRLAKTMLKEDNS